MYNIYKYYNVLELEQSLKNQFPQASNGITILPPLLKKIGYKYVLAYLVIKTPIEIDHHLGVTRPIGVIYRNRKNGKVLNIYNFEQYEFIIGNDDYNREYYSLESHPDFLPNRTPENEEGYRLALELLYKISNKITLFKGIDNKLYEEYKNFLKELFPPNYMCFYDALQNNDIFEVNDVILQLRNEANKNHEKEQIIKQERANQINKIARQDFIEELKKEIYDFVESDILSSLDKKSPYAQIDFYVYLGKMLKNIVEDEKKYFNCYSITLTRAAIEQNKAIVFENQKVQLVKTYAKACAKTVNEDDNVNNVCEAIFNFLDAEIEEELIGKLTSEIKTKITQSLNKIDTLLSEVFDQNVYNYLKPIWLEIQNDYFNMPKENEISDLYYGYKFIQTKIKKSDK